MKTNLEIGEYKIISEFKVGSFSKWATAEKKGSKFFVKEYLSPVHPDENYLGSELSKQKKVDACIKFEASQIQKIEILSSLNNKTNIITSEDFFKYKTKYYKVTALIQDKVDFASILNKSLSEKLNILIKISSSLKNLHENNIVHGDLNPNNIIYDSKDNVYLIDFDNIFLSGQPMDYNEIIGDFNFFPPEFVRYIKLKGEFNPAKLNLKSDIFQLGLIFCYILSGKPPHTLWQDSPLYEIIYNQQEIQLPKLDILEKDIQDLILSMFDISPSNRPNIEEVIKVINHIHNSQTEIVNSNEKDSSFLKSLIYEQDKTISTQKTEIDFFKQENKKLKDKSEALEKNIIEERELIRKLSIFMENFNLINPVKSDFVYLKKKCMELISRSYLEKALEEIIIFAEKEGNIDLLKHSVHQSSRINKIKREVDLGIISHENQELEINKIRNAILEIIINFKE